MFGADIEFFVSDPETGQPVPACGRFGGAKGAAIPMVDADPENYSMLEDGAALELNYKPKRVAGLFMDMVARSAWAIAEQTKHNIISTPCVKFNHLEQFPQAMMIGCDPDFYAYGKNPEAPRKIPDIKLFEDFRFAGGHLHISYDMEGGIPPYVAARLTDVIVTLPVMLDNTQADIELLFGKERKKFYGLPGLYRPKEYGVEYRTFSNAFAYRKPLQRSIATNLSTLASVLENPQFAQDLHVQVDWGDVKKAILGPDLPLAQRTYNGISRQLRRLRQVL